MIKLLKGIKTYTEIDISDIPKLGRLTAYDQAYIAALKDGARQGWQMDFLAYLSENIDFVNALVKLTEKGTKESLNIDAAEALRRATVRALIEFASQSEDMFIDTEQYLGD